MYIITARRMIPEELLKQRSGFLIREGYETAPSASTRFNPTLPPIKARGKQSPASGEIIANPTGSYRSEPFAIRERPSLTAPNERF